MAFLQKRRNNAVYTNPPVLQGSVADIHITERGSNWLWAVFSIFAVSTLVLLGLTLRRPVTHRVFHYILTLALLVATLDYYALASNLGFVPIPVEFQRSHRTVSGSIRQIWYCRYIDWFISTALLWLAILLVARAPWEKILFVLVLDWITVAVGLAGALTPTVYKWGWYAFGLFTTLVIAYTVLVPIRRHAGLAGRDIGRAYTLPTIWFVFLWILYPIAWGLSEGGNVIAPNSEQVFYGILDILAKLGVTGLLLWGLRAIEPERLGLRYRGWDTQAAPVEKNGHITTA